MAEVPSSTTGTGAAGACAQSLLYDLRMSGKKIFVCGWYHVEDGHIKTLRVIFDPRPVLEKSQAKH